MKHEIMETFNGYLFLYVYVFRYTVYVYVDVTHVSQVIVSLNIMHVHTPLYIMH